MNQTFIFFCWFQMMLVSLRMVEKRKDYHYQVGIRIPKKPGAGPGPY